VKPLQTSHATTEGAADRLNITPRRVRALIQAEQLRAEKKARDYLIEEKDLKLVKNRKPGRPRLSKKQRSPC
jgi:hypothetical protein